VSRSSQGALFAADQEALFAPRDVGSKRTVVLAVDPLTTARAHLSGRTVLTPNERAARALLGRRVGSVSLAERAVRALRSRGTHVASPLERLMVLRQVVAADGSWADVRGTARRLEPVVSELLRAGLGVRPHLSAALRASTDVAPRTTRVAELAVSYSRLLAQRGEVDPAEALWLGATAVQEQEPLLTYGYSRLGAAETAFLAALAGDGSVLVLPAGFSSSDEAAAALSALGWDLQRDERAGLEVGPLVAEAFTRSVTAPAGATERAQTAATGTPDGLAALLLADQEEEVRWVLARVKALLASGALADDVVLVARDERSYGPLVRAVAAEFAIPVRLAYAVPLKESRLGEVAIGLVAAVGRRLPFEETARLLRHPLVRVLTDEAWVTARAWHPEGPGEWGNAGAAVAGLLDWPAKSTWQGYRELFEATLEGLGVAGRAEGRDRRALARLLKSLRHAAPPGGAKDEAATLGDFLALLTDVIETAVLPVDPPGRGAVELHTPLAVFGARYEHVFVLGLSEGVFPQAVREDPVIDFMERRALAGLGLKLEDAEGAAEREELSFLAVLHAAGSSLTLTAPRMAGSSERLPSPYLAAAGVTEDLRVGPRPPASALEELIVRLPGATGAAARAWGVERRRESAQQPDAHDGITGEPVHVSGPFSATQLTTFGQCSFRWFGQHGLRLSEVTEAEEEVTPLTAGSVFHDTLKTAVERVMRRGDAGATGDPEMFRTAVVEELEAAYEAAHEEREKRGERVRSKTWPLQKSENLDKLRRLVRSADFILAGSRVADLEKGFRATWREIPVRGVVDRIDVERTPDGERLVLTDYKLGKSAPRGAKGPRGTLNLDVQLPLYIEAAAPALHPGAQVGAARYLSINGANVSKVVDPAKVDSAALDGLVARFRTALASGAFPLDPDPRQEACQYCPFDPVCRRGPRLSRKTTVESVEREEAA